MSEKKITCSTCGMGHTGNGGYTHCFAEHLAAPLKASMGDISAMNLIGDLAGKNISTIRRRSLVQRMQAGR